MTPLPHSPPQPKALPDEGANAWVPDEALTAFTHGVLAEAGVMRNVCSSTFIPAIRDALTRGWTMETVSELSLHLVQQSQNKSNPGGWLTKVLQRELTEDAPAPTETMSAVDARKTRAAHEEAQVQAARAASDVREAQEYGRTGTCSSIKRLEAQIAEGNRFAEPVLRIVTESLEAQARALGIEPSAPGDPLAGLSVDQLVASFDMEAEQAQWTRYQSSALVEALQARADTGDEEAAVACRRVSRQLAAGVAK
jgi:hypothetical protein